MSKVEIFFPELAEFFGSSSVSVAETFPITFDEEEKEIYFHKGPLCEWSFCYEFGVYSQDLLVVWIKQGKIKKGERRAEADE